MWLVPQLPTLSDSITMQRASHISDEELMDLHWGYDQLELNQSNMKQTKQQHILNWMWLDFNWFISFGLEIK